MSNKLIDRLFEDLKLCNKENKENNDYEAKVALLTEENNDYEAKVALLTEENKKLHKRLDIKNSDRESLNLKDLHIHCRENRSSRNSYIQNKIIKDYNMTKTSAERREGDALYKNYKIELKNSVASPTSHFVQIRLHQPIDYYLLTSLTSDNKLYMFLISHLDMRDLILKYGSYAHGSKKDLGPIKESIDKPNVEFALRPKHGGKCWNEMLEFHSKNELLNI